MEIVKEQLKNLPKILECLNKGGVIISPTDTVYGLLADATNEKAVKKVFEIKKRPLEKPLPVFIRNTGDLKKLAIIDDKKVEFIKKYWPGKLTVVLKASKEAEEKIKKGVVGKDKKIGLRIPDHNFVKKILKEFKKPLTSTSANISGEQSMIDVKDLKIKPDLIIDGGKLKESSSSTVIDFSGSKIKILRKGDYESLFI